VNKKVRKDSSDSTVGNTRNDVPAKPVTQAELRELLDKYSPEYVSEILQNRYAPAKAERRVLPGNAIGEEDLSEILATFSCSYVSRVLRASDSAANPQDSIPERAVIREEDLTDLLNRYTPKYVSQILRQRLSQNGANSFFFMGKAHAEAYSEISSPPEFQPSSAKIIVRPPGSLLSRAAEFLFSRKTLTRIVNPIISDLQAEYFEALGAKRPAKAVWVRLRGYWGLFKAVGLHSILKMVVEIWREL
jgi:hypothetical protein